MNFKVQKDLIMPWIEFPLYCRSLAPFIGDLSRDRAEIVRPDLRMMCRDYAARSARPARSTFSPNIVL